MSVDVTLSHPWTDDDGTFYDVGARLEMEDGEANRLINNGVAQASTKAAAKAAGVDPETAASAKK